VLQLSTSFPAAAFVHCITVTTGAVTTLLLPNGHGRVQLFRGVAPTSIAWRRKEGRGCSSSSMGNCLAEAAGTTFTDWIVADCSLWQGLFASPSGWDSRPRVVACADVLARYGVTVSRAMRMSEDAFDVLVSMLGPRLPSRGYSPEVRTAIALRYLGGGSFIDISAVFGTSISSFYSSFWGVVDTTKSATAMDLHLPLEDYSWRLRTAAGLQSRGDGPFVTILGALDGIVVKQEQPATTDVACLSNH